MTPPTRVVDAHVHLWDPARTDWYPYLSQPARGDPGRRGDVPALRRRHLPDRGGAVARREDRQRRRRHRSQLGRRNLGARCQGRPSGAARTPSSAGFHLLTPPPRRSGSSTGRWRRPASAGSARWAASAVAVPDADVMRALQDRNLVFELMAHPDQLLQAAEELSSFDDLTVVVEHTGWPRNDSDEERALWREGMQRTGRARRQRRVQALGPRHAARVDAGRRPPPVAGTLRSRPSAPSAACSPATSRSIRPPGASTTSTPRSTRSPAVSTSASREALFAGTAERIYRL